MGPCLHVNMNTSGSRLGCCFGSIDKMNTKVRYNAAPLVLALLEVRHPLASLGTDASLSALRESLRGTLPIYDPQSVSEMELNFVPGQDPAGRTRQTEIHVFRSRDKRTSLTIGPRSFSLETSAYDGWAKFRDLLGVALTSRTAASEIDGVERVGLRYIDEIRIPGAPGVSPSWGDWLHASVVAPNPSELKLEVLQQQCVIQYRPEDPEDTLTLRYGAVNGPPAVNGPIRTEVPDDGHYFLLDTDAAWTPGTVPQYAPDELLSVADRIHDCTQELFESVLTDRLRREVFNG